MTDIPAEGVAPRDGATVEARPRRWALTVLAVIGLALIAMPLVFNMFSRAPKGAAMIAEFKPFMTVDRLDGYQLEIRQINAGEEEADTAVAARLTGTADPVTASARLDRAYPTFGSFTEQWGGIDAHMTTLLDTVQRNLGNYEAVAALPSFTLFPWFFVLPGIVLLALLGLFLLRPRWWRGIRWALVVLGIGLVLAPAIFQMFQRAPKGGQMMSAFKNIETVSNVERIQGYFGSIAVGQGAIRLQLVPALIHDGMTPAQVRAEYAAVTTLDHQWVHILNDMTPMIGAMSENVTNYRAIAALPSFPLFPYFFVLPGVLVAGVAIAAGPRRRRDSSPDGARS